MLIRCEKTLIKYMEKELDDLIILLDVEFHIERYVIERYNKDFIYLKINKIFSDSVVHHMFKYTGLSNRIDKTYFANFLGYIIPKKKVLRLKLLELLRDVVIADEHDTQYIEQLNVHYNLIRISIEEDTYEPGAYFRYRCNIENKDNTDTLSTQQLSTTDIFF